MAITKLVSNSLGEGVGGSMVLLDTTEITSAVASVTINPPFSTTYSNYIIYGVGLRIDTDNKGFQFQLVNSGGTASTASYYYALTQNDGASTVGQGNNQNVSEFVLTNGTATTAHAENFTIQLTNPAASNYTSIVWTSGGRRSGGNGHWSSGAGYHNIQSAYTQFKILPSSGNLNQGKILTYGTTE
tara:strand:+ start:369 stop:926 length:558 start_codon:yes stop_codon:yes gene_type:complete